MDEFLRIAESSKEAESIEYILVLQIRGDIHESKKNFNEARSAWSSAQKAFLKNAGFVKRHPELDQAFTKRLSTEREKHMFENCPNLIQKLHSGLLQLSNEMMWGRNRGPENDEVTIVSDVVQRSNFMDD